MTTWGCTLFKNIAWAAGSEGLLRVSRIILVILMVRWLGPTQYGMYAFAVALIGMFSAIFDPGISILVQRSLTRNPRFVRLLRNIFRLKLTVLSISILLLVISLPLLTDGLERQLLVLIMGVCYACLEVINTAYVTLRGLGKFKFEFILRLFFSITSSLIILLSIFLDPTAITAATSQGFIAFVFCGAILVYVRRKTAPAYKRGSYKIDRILLKRAMPIGIAGAAAIGYANVDTFLLGMTASDMEVGIYNAALRILLILQLPTAIIGQALYSLLSRDLYVGAPELHVKWAHVYKIIWMLSIIAALVLVSSGEYLAILVFGRDYIRSGVVLSIFATTLPGFFLFPIFAQVLIMSGYEKSVTFAVACVLFIIVTMILFEFGDNQLHWLTWCMAIGNGMLAICLGAFLKYKMGLAFFKPLVTPMIISAIFFEVFLVVMLNAFNMNGSLKLVLLALGSMLTIALAIVLDRKVATLA